VGKDADIAIWNAYPLSVYANVDKTFIDGEIFFDRQKDIAQRADKERERNELERADQGPPRGRATNVVPQENR
jgi:hypothetical protein